MVSSLYLWTQQALLKRLLRLAGQVALVLDQDLFDHETINVHPLRNDQTTNLRTKDLVAFAKAQNHMPAVIEIPQRISS